MVNIRKMRMAMTDHVMLMGMTMGGVPGDFFIMFMLMMFVVGMPMGVLQRLMQMDMLMALGQVQPDAKHHERRRDPEQHRHRLTQNQDGDRRAQERCCREIRSGPRSPQATQCQYKKHQTDTVAQKADQQCRA